MNNKLDKIFEIVSFYDNARWSRKENYNLINFYKEGLNDDTKLLTHWLCYITNRQMGFERIFDIGGFVFSELVDRFKKNETIDWFTLLDPNNKESFIRKDTDDKEEYSFIGKNLPNDLIRKDYSDNIENNQVVFKSRFLPTDYFSILCTLDILEKYGKSLSCFISDIYKIHKDDKKNLVRKILFSLHLLSYNNIGQKKYLDVGNVEISYIRNRSNKVRDILMEQNKNEFNARFEKFAKEKIFRQKRAWCCLRDFLKSPEFKQYFIESMSTKELDKEELKELFSNEMLSQLELPGDVWNNSPKFQRCVRNISDGQIEKRYDESKFNQFVRKKYDDSQILKSGIAYPEQFDITFDFVPRMCDKNSCDICPIGLLYGKGENFENICSNNASKFCPVALVGCGYRKTCDGHNECELRKVIL